MVGKELLKNNGNCEDNEMPVLSVATLFYALLTASRLGDFRTFITLYFCSR